LGCAKAKRDHAAGAASGVDPLVMSEIKKEFQRAGDTLSGTGAHSNLEKASLKGSRLISRAISKTVTNASLTTVPQTRTQTKPGSAADDKITEAYDNTED